MGTSTIWANSRIMIGTILGAGLGFYVMHRLEIVYKRQWDERLRKYEEELERKKGIEESF